jgi:hypothetical protein
MHSTSSARTRVRRARGESVGSKGADRASILTFMSSSFARSGRHAAHGLLQTLLLPAGRRTPPTPLRERHHAMRSH